MSFASNREYASFKIYRYTKSGYFAEITSEIVYKDKSGLEVKVIKGFRTDFASIPKCLQSFISPIGKHSQASVIHDYLYAKNSYGIKDGLATKVSRRAADKIFYNSMLDSNVNKFTAIVMWAMVRAFGYFSFHKREA